LSTPDLLPPLLSTQRRWKLINTNLVALRLYQSSCLHISNSFRSVALSFSILIMNWTGGRLQRHSKANANATLKAQKQHFAKARLQQQNGRPEPSPLQVSAFKVPIKEDEKVDRDRSRGVKRPRSPERLGG
jgi:hypothetical protein